MKEESVPGQGEDSNTGDTDKSQSAKLLQAEGVEEPGPDDDKASADANMKDSEALSGEKDTQEVRQEDKEEKQVEDTKAGTEGEEMEKNKKEEESNPEEKAKEAGKGVNEQAAKTSEIDKPVEDVKREANNNGKMKEMEKQGKPKRKSGPSPSARARPRPSARSIRAAARNDIIAKFQQGAPE